MFLCRGLWDPYRLARNITRRNYTETKTEFVAGNSLKKRLDFMEIKASLKASFLSGLIQIGGSAHFLEDTRSRSYSANVLMKMSHKAYFEELTTYHLNLSNIDYPAVLEDPEATHVVVRE